MDSLSCYPFPDYLLLSSTYSQDQQFIETKVREFVGKRASCLIKEAYRNECFPESLIQGFGELGILGASLKGYNLPGMDAIASGLIMKELERCDSALRSFVSVQSSLVMYPILAFGSEAQKEEWLPLLASGKKIGCFGLTEESGGSDPASMKTIAQKKGDQWILNGSKMWLTNGSLAHLAIIWAQTKEGIRGFLVPTNTKGVTIHKIKNKLSLRASASSKLSLDTVTLPSHAILPKSSGLKSALSCLSQARYGITWGVLGAAEACFAEACSYVKHRMLFGSTLASKQLVQRKLAKMLTSITQGQLLARRLGELKDINHLHYAQISMGKQSNSKMALSVARTCRDILGGKGIIDDNQTMRHLCNLETVYTYEGTNDIHLLIMGSMITGETSF